MYCLTHCMVMVVSFTLRTVIGILENRNCRTGQCVYNRVYSAICSWYHAVSSVSFTELCNSADTIPVVYGARNPCVGTWRECYSSSGEITGAIVFTTEMSVLIPSSVRRSCETRSGNCVVSSNVNSPAVNESFSKWVTMP